MNNVPMSYKALLMKDFGFTHNDLLKTLEDNVDLIKKGHSFNRIFKVVYIRLKIEGEKYELGYCN